MLPSAFNAPMNQTAVLEHCQCTTYKSLEIKYARIICFTLLVAEYFHYFIYCKDYGFLLLQLNIYRFIQISVVETMLVNFKYKKCIPVLSWFRTVKRSKHSFELFSVFRNNQRPHTYLDK